MLTQNPRIHPAKPDPTSAYQCASLQAQQVSKYFLKYLWTDSNETYEQNAEPSLAASKEYITTLQESNLITGAPNIFCKWICEAPDKNCETYPQKSFPDYESSLIQQNNSCFDIFSLKYNVMKFNCKETPL